MPEIAIDNIANAILEHCAATLLATTQDGLQVFAEVQIVNDVESFIRVADVLKTAGQVVIGLVAGTEESRDGMSDSEEYHRLPIDVVVRFSQLRNPGGTELTAIERARNYLETAKKALMVDPTRGGLCELVPWAGEVINGTSVRGTMRPLAKPNEAFYSAAAQVVCCWLTL
jgi:hypothetical protein